MDSVPTLKGGSTVGVPSPPAIWLESGEIVTPDLRDAERLQGFTPDWTRPAEQVVKPGFRWKLVGNAVSVPVARWLGERLARPSDFRVSGSRRLRQGDPWPRSAWNVGEGRFEAMISSWPVQRRTRSLAEFLAFPPEPLSLRATAGFHHRASVSTLRFPNGFLAAIEAHLGRVAKADQEGICTRGLRRLICQGNFASSELTRRPRNAWRGSGSVILELSVPFARPPTLLACDSAYGIAIYRELLISQIASGAGQCSSTDASGTAIQVVGGRQHRREIETSGLPSSRQTESGTGELSPPFGEWTFRR